MRNICGHSLAVLWLLLPCNILGADSPPKPESDESLVDLGTEGFRAAARKLAQESAAAPTAAEKKAIEDKLSALDKKNDDQVRKKPDSPQTLGSAAGYELERGRPEKAENLAEKALSLARPDGNPKLTARLLVTRGLLRYNRHDYSGAHEDAALALENDPDNWAAFELFVYSLEKWPKGKKLPSLEIARRSGLKGTAEGDGANLRPASGVLARGNTAPAGSEASPAAPAKEDQAADQERVARLMALQTPGIARSPEEWVARQRAEPSPAYEFLTRAKNAQLAGDLPRALGLAEAAVKADPADPMVYAQRALILNQMGDSSGATLDLSRVIAKGWKWSLAFRLRADALFKAGNWRAALADAELAARLDPMDADAIFIRAMARSRLGGDPALILADLERAADLKPALAPFRDKAREKLGKSRGPGR